MTSASSGVAKPSQYVWLINPDAERELAAVRSYAVRAAFVKRMATLGPLFETLTQGERVRFSHEPSSAEDVQYGVQERALIWCPTTEALLAARRFGLGVPTCPTMDVLRRVHSKRFISEALADWVLPGRTFVQDEAAWKCLRAQMRGPIRLKRPFGYAGKGQRIWPEQGSRDDLRWLSDSLRQGGFLAEPHVVPAVELSLHGFVDAAGWLFGAPCVLTTDARGIPLDVRLASHGELLTEPTRLAQLAQSTAEALAHAGYFGPFGVDVLVLDGAPFVIDLNPRFTLGWSIGMRAHRDVAIARALDPKPY